MRKENWWDFGKVKMTEGIKSDSSPTQVRLGELEFVENIS